MSDVSSVTRASSHRNFSGVRQDRQQSKKKAEKVELWRRTDAYLEAQSQGLCPSCSVYLRRGEDGSVEGLPEGLSFPEKRLQKKIWASYDELAERRKHCIFCRFAGRVLSAEFNDATRPKDFLISHGLDGFLIISINDIDKWEAYRRINDPNGIMLKVVPSDADGVPLEDSIYHFVGKSIDWKVARSWLHDCDEHHGSNCRASFQSAWPTRPDMSLIDVNKLTLLWPAPEGEYAVLSYTWGGAQKTKLHNTDQACIDLRPYHKEFPQTVKDAITVTREMGLKYLWVDALCIQDRPRRSSRHAEDGRPLSTATDEGSREASQAAQFANMHKIYGSASFCIVAAQGVSAHAGLSGVVKESMGDDGVLHEDHIDPRPDFKGQMRTSRPILDRGVVTTVLPLPGDVSKSKWATRAWCLQEQLLSRRYLIFYDDQVYFQCREGMQFEDMALTWKSQIPRVSYSSGDDIPCQIRNLDVNMALFDPVSTMTTRHRAIDRDGRNTWVVRSAVYQEYQTIIQLYSQRDLTVPTDALKAVDGLLSVVKQQIGGDMLGGLPAEMLDAALLWTAAEPLQRRGQQAELSDEPSEEHLPSWSWAGWKGAVRWNDVFEFNKKTQKLDPIRPSATMYDLPRENMRPFVTWYVAAASETPGLDLVEEGEEGDSPPHQHQADHRPLCAVNSSGLDARFFGRSKIPNGWRSPRRDPSYDRSLDAQLLSTPAKYAHCLHLCTMECPATSFVLGHDKQNAWTIYSSFNSSGHGEAVGELWRDGDWQQGGQATRFHGPRVVPGNSRYAPQRGYEALIVLSEAQFFAKDSLNRDHYLFRHLEDFYLYNVLLVRVDGGVARREGVGRILQRAWDEAKPRWKVLRLD